MATEIRPELSEKNPYWIGKHRYYELKHFCLQYPIWKKAYNALLGLSSRPNDLDTLALMGYRLYRAEIRGVDAPDGVVLISKDRLSKRSAIKWIPIDKYVWIAKEIKNDVG